MKVISKAKKILIGVIFSMLLGGYLVFMLIRRNKNLQAIADEIGGNPKHSDKARLLSVYLGTGIDVWSFTEEDKKAYDTLRLLSYDDLTEIAVIYNMVYTKGRDLRSDILSLLDSKYLNMIPHLFEQGV